MPMVRIGLSLPPRLPCPPEQLLHYLRDAQFSAISPAYSRDLPLEELAKSAANMHFAIQSLHAPYAPFGGISGLWTPGDPLGEQVKHSVFDCIDACARFGIPTMVMHGWQGFTYTFSESLLQFSNFDSIVDHGEKRGVAIAFENLEGEEYLQALLHRYRDRSHVGYCWDCGHAHCYPHRLDFPEVFGNRLIMTHLHDNWGMRGDAPTGLDDLHFLPYDGNLHWESAIRRLQNLPRQQILNFEVKQRAASNAPEDLLYDTLSVEAFYAKAGQRALRIAALYEQVMDENKA